ncbi:glycosyltransferase family 87 protein [Prevotella sp. 10(H)]|uniref:glycosyltransferase family 87 protein n=1 Tax=Prevotella sp. 10(H) TaxID=1158294 RepID=UPI000ABC218E|nr:glycosyltransferase family 87 protein [Prevotella sp. 10(H)]
MLEQINLYVPYPAEYHDTNHYGPFFSVVIAPFALLPDRMGILFWDVAMSLCLFFAIYYLPIAWKKKYLFYYIILIELYTCVMNSQTNGLIAALIIGSLLCIRKEKDIWAACFIMFGTFIKLYGIVGLSFFFFSKHKGKLIAYLLMWAAIFFVLPMLISSPSFVIQSYQDWFHSLADKNIENITNFSQDISAIGLIRRCFDMIDISALYIIIPGLVLFGLQYLKPERYGELTFQLGILASTLFFIVLFSTGSEKETYIIAMTALAIWYCLQKNPNNKWTIGLLVFTIFWTWLSSSHIFPKSIHTGIFKRYSLKVIPHLIVWLILVYQIITSRGLKELPDNEYIGEK